MLRESPAFSAVGGIPGREHVWGIAGTGAKPMIAEADIHVFYVDSGHANASDDNEGLDPQYPFATLNGCLANTNVPVGDYDVIYVNGSLTESVVTNDYDTGPNYVTLIGGGPSRYSPSWSSGDDDEPCLDLRAIGWRVSGFRFYAPVNDAAIVLRHTDTGANDIAIRTVIDNNYFDGLTTGLRGIESHGCYDVWVVNNTFSLIHNVGGTATAMEVTTTPLAIPYRNHVVGNKFYDCDNGMVWPSNGSFFYENMVQPVGYAYSMTAVFQTSLVANPGDDNVVWGNTFPGDYSIAGGYRPGAADEWLGNWASDTAEAEVGDNGITIARPT